MENDYATPGSPIASSSTNPLLILAATGLLAILSIALGFVGVAERKHLLQEGRKTDGIVVAIDVGVKGLHSVEAQFTRVDGRRVVGRDIHRTQWYAANDRGDAVELYYDPADDGDAPPDILIDRGAWIWSNPVLLIVAGVALLALGYYLARQPRRDGGG